MVATLTEVVEAKDINKLQEVLETVKVKIQELIAMNPEIAKEYATKVQNFLKENADKVKAIVGDNAAVGAAVSALTNVSVDDVINNFMSSAEGAAKDAVEGAKDAAAQAVEDAKDAAVDKANAAVNDAKAKGAAAIDEAAEAAKKKLGM